MRNRLLNQASATVDPTQLATAVTAATSGKADTTALTVQKDRIDALETSQTTQDTQLATDALVDQGDGSFEYTSPGGTKTIIPADQIVENVGPLTGAVPAGKVLGIDTDTNELYAPKAGVWVKSTAAPLTAGVLTNFLSSDGDFPTAKIWAAQVLEAWRHSNENFTPLADGGTAEVATGRSVDPGSTIAAPTTKSDGTPLEYGDYFQLSLTGSGETLGAANVTGVAETPTFAGKEASQHAWFYNGSDWIDADPALSDLLTQAEVADSASTEEGTVTGQLLAAWLVNKQIKQLFHEENTFDFNALGYPEKTVVILQNKNPAAGLLVTYGSGGTYDLQRTVSGGQSAALVSGQDTMTLNGGQAAIIERVGNTVCMTIFEANKYKWFDTTANAIAYGPLSFENFIAIAETGDLWFRKTGTSVPFTGIEDADWVRVGSAAGGVNIRFSATEEITSVDTIRIVNLPADWPTSSPYLANEDYDFIFKGTVPYTPSGQVTSAAGVNARIAEGWEILGPNQPEGDHALQVIRVTDGFDPTAFTVQWQRAGIIYYEGLSSTDQTLDVSNVPQPTQIKDRVETPIVGSYTLEIGKTYKTWMQGTAQWFIKEEAQSPGPTAQNLNPRWIAEAVDSGDATVQSLTWLDPASGHPAATANDTIRIVGSLTLDATNYTDGQVVRAVRDTVGNIDADWALWTNPSPIQLARETVGVAANVFTVNNDRYSWLSSAGVAIGDTIQMPTFSGWNGVTDERRGIIDNDSGVDLTITLPGGYIGTGNIPATLKNGEVLHWRQTGPTHVTGYAVLTSSTPSGLEVGDAISSGVTSGPSNSAWDTPIVSFTINKAGKYKLTCETDERMAIATAGDDATVGGVIRVGTTSGASDIWTENTGQHAYNTDTNRVGGGYPWRGFIESDWLDLTPGTYYFYYRTTDPLDVGGNRNQLSVDCKLSWMGLVGEVVLPPDEDLRVEIPVGDTSLVANAWSDTDLGFDPLTEQGGRIIVETTLNTIEIELPMRSGQQYFSGLIQADNDWEVRAIANGGNNIGIAASYNSSAVGTSTLLRIWHYKAQKTVVGSSQLVVNKVGLVEGDLLSYDAANDRLIRRDTIRRTASAGTIAGIPLAANTWGSVAQLTGDEIPVPGDLVEIQYGAGDGSIEKFHGYGTDGSLNQTVGMPRSGNNTYFRVTGTGLLQIYATDAGMGWNYIRIHRR